MRMKLEEQDGASLIRALAARRAVPRMGGFMERPFRAHGQDRSGMRLSLEVDKSVVPRGPANTPD